MSTKSILDLMDELIAVDDMFVKITFPDGEYSVAVISSKFEHRGVPFFIAHGAHKYLTPSRTIDVSEVEMDYFDPIILCWDGNELTALRHGVWPPVAMERVVSGVTRG